MSKILIRNKQKNWHEQELKWLEISAAITYLNLKKQKNLLHRVLKGQRSGSFAVNLEPIQLFFSIF